jgi:hypothetical protein
MQQAYSIVGALAIAVDRGWIDVHRGFSGRSTYRTTALGDWIIKFNARDLDFAEVRQANKVARLAALTTRDSVILPPNYEKSGRAS